MVVLCDVGGWKTLLSVLGVVVLVGDVVEEVENESLLSIPLDTGGMLVKAALKLE